MLVFYLCLFYFLTIYLDTVYTQVSFGRFNGDTTGHIHMLGGLTANISKTDSALQTSIHTYSGAVVYMPSTLSLASMNLSIIFLL